MIKEINLSIDILKKIFKLTDIYFITDIVEQIDLQCLKFGFYWSGYEIYLYIGAGFVKAIANQNYKHLFEFKESISGVGLGVAVQKAVTNLYDNINKHVQSQVNNNGNEPQRGADLNEGSENIYY